MFKWSIGIVCGLLLLCVGLGLWAHLPHYTQEEWGHSGVHIYNVKAPKQEEVPQNLRVVTFNLGYASGDKNSLGSVLTREEVLSRLEAAKVFLKTLNPDVLLLQEIDFCSARSHCIDQMKFLALGLGLRYAHHVTTWNHRYVAWPYWPVSKHFGAVLSGQAVLSRYPLVPKEVVVFDKPQANPFWYNWFYLNRVLQKVSVKFGKQWLTFWHAHLEAFDDKTRREQLHRVTHLLKKHSTSFRVLAGDFNAELDEILPSLQKSYPQTVFSHSIQSPTYPSSSPNQDIDHIFAFGSHRVIKSGVAGDPYVSDHLAKWTVLSSSDQEFQ